MFPISQEGQQAALWRCALWNTLGRCASCSPGKSNENIHEAVMSYSSHASVTHLRLMRIDRVFTNFASVNRGKLKQDNAPAIILQGRELSLRH